MILGSTIGEAWVKYAKLGRGTDRRSVPSSVLVPDQAEMKLCKLRAQEKTNLSYLVAICG